MICRAVPFFHIKRNEILIRKVYEFEYGSLYDYEVI